MKMKFLILTGLFLVIAPAFAQTDAMFNAGKEAYKAENYQEAIDSWRQIVDNGEESPELYFNLGNAHYKLNNIGPSIYYFEKARILDPNDADIKNNLAFAENARVDVIEPLPQTVFKTWYERISGVTDFDGWATAGVVFTFSFVFLFLTYYFSASERKKRFLFASSIVALFLLMASVAMAFTTYADYQNNNPAIVFSEKVEVKDAPSVGGEVSFLIHEGTKVQVLDRETNWVRIRLADGKDGWIPSADIKEL